MTLSPRPGSGPAHLELRAVLENATVGIVFTRDRRLVQANSLCAEMFGYTLEEFIGLPGLALHPSQEAYDALGHVAAPKLATGQPYRDEREMRRKDGSLFWCRISARAVNPAKARDGTLWIMEDASEDRRLREELQQTSRELTALFDNAVVGIAVVRERRVARCNPRFAELFGSTVDGMVGQPVRQMFLSDEEYEATGLKVYEDFANGREHQREQRYRQADGNLGWLRVLGRAFDPSNPQAGSVWLADDITGVKLAADRLRQAFHEQQIIFDNAAVGILFVRDRLVRRCNSKLEDIFGYGPGELEGRSTRVFYLSEEDYQRHGALVYEAILGGETFIGENRVRRKDGSAFWVRATGRRADTSDEQFDVIWIFEDVTERHQAEEALLRAHDELEQRVVERTAELATANAQLQAEVFERMQAEQRVWHIAHHDGLTGLPNRTLLHDRLEQSLVQGERGNHRVAVMFLDLDRFKTINDTLGHAVGDELLKHVAQRLSGAVRAVDTVSRLGGDEFVVVLQDVGGADDVVQVAEKILAALAPTVVIEGHELRATPSIGISVFPDDGREVFELMKNADTAMYHAKTRGRNNFQFFATGMNEEASRFFQLETRLRHALERGDLRLCYQPLVDLQPGRLCGPLCGLEALVRWQEPEQGTISPGEFIPVAEETGLILSIGEWVLGEALRQNRVWQEQGRPLVPISVNLSPRQFRQKGLVDMVRRILADTGQPARLLELEITESTLIQDVGETLARLQELSAMGVRLAIDDFGTGYSSLSYLKRFPVDKLKVDQSFVRELTESADDAAIVSAVINLSRSLGLATLAEGVETPAQLTILRQLGCSQFQGYFFSRPLPAEMADRLFSPALPLPSA